MVQPFCSKSADTWRWNVNLKFKGQLKSRHLFFRLPISTHLFRLRPKNSEIWLKSPETMND